MIARLQITHSVPISGTSDPRNTRLLYRIFGPNSTEYILVAGLNHIYQFDAHTLRSLSVRTTGRKNFSIFCSPSGVCGPCDHSDQTLFRMGYKPGDCGPRETDSVVKAWATSTVPESEVPRIPESYVFYQRGPGESVLLNDDRIACENALYVCHNLYHGFCERLSLTNIREASPWTPSFTNPFEPSPEESDKVPVTGSDPIKHVALAVGLRYVYVATEPDKLPQYTLVKTYPISVRSRDFQFAHRQPAPECILRLTETIPVPIQYKRAFRYRAHLSPVGNKPQSLPPAHIYFVFQQPESPQFNRWQPRISRVCDNDMRFFSHVELNLACKDCTPAYYTQETFNALHTAARGTVGQLLAGKLRTQQDSQLTEDHTEGLVVAFAAQHVDSQYHRAFAAQSNDPYHTRGSPNFGSGAVMLNGSVVSMFSMAQVDAQFKYVIDKCLSGDGVFGPAHFLTTRERVHGQCVKDEAEKAEKYYCPKDRPRNRLIMGSDRDDALEAPAFLHLHENVVDLVVTAVSEQFTVVLLATDDGWLLEYEVTDVSQSRRLEALQLDPDRRPVTSVAIDITGTIAYATTQEKVVRVKLANCDVHLTCAACIKARDPFCGWCVIEGRCLPLAECRSLGENRTGHTESNKARNNRCSPNVNTPRTTTLESTSAFTWLAYTASIDRCPVIKQLSPTGVQRMDSSSSPLDERFNQHTIMLKLDGDLAKDLHRLLPPITRDSEQFQLSCAFRDAPTSMLNSTALLTGSLLQSEVNELLVGVVPTGRLLGKTGAKFILSEPDASEVQCFSLPLSKLPAVPKGQASVPILLWLEWFDSTGHISEAHWPPLAPGMFAVYDCRRLNDCRQCSQSLFGCAWCLLDDQCVPAVGMPQGTHSPAICPGSALTEGGDDSNVVVMSTTGPKCPGFKSEEGQLTLMSGSTLSAKFRVHNIRQPLKHFSCLDGCTNQRVIASYDASESTVICHIEKIVLGTRLGLMHEQFPGSAISRSDAITHCSLDIFWHGQDSRSEEGHRMVNEDNVSVEVYTCEWLAEFCDVCLTLPPRFGCGWCVASDHNMCSTRNQCLDQSNGPIVLSSPSPRSWLHLGDVCPDPQITSISPLNGTLTGQTVLHIEGRNLGRGFGDLAGGIYLQTPQSVPCTILPASYNHSRTFDCRLSSADYLTLPASGRLKVVISEHRFQAFSPVFRFLKPELTEISPTRGPIAGGTRLRITGKNLNVGAKRHVSLERNKNGVDGKNGEPMKLSLPCDIERESSQLITCRTRPLPPTVVESMNDRNGVWRFENRQHFANFEDGDEEEEEADEGHFPMSIQLRNDMTVTNPSTPVKFIYSPNPHIDAVERENVLASAGTSIRVKGKFLFVIETPRIVFYFNWSEHSSPCIYRQDEGLNCISPTIGRHLEVSRRDIDPGGLQFSGLFRNSNSSTLLSLPQTATVRTNASAELLSDVKLNLRKTAMQSLQKSTAEWPSRLAFGFVLDGVKQLRVYGSLQVLPDPVVHPFPGGVRHEELDDFTSVKNPDIAEGEQRKVMPKRGTQESSDSTNGSLKQVMNGDNEKTPAPQSHQLLRLHGQFESLVRAPELTAPEELSVRLGNSHICFVSSVIASEIRCDLDRASLISGRNYPVVVQFGHFLIYHPGVVRFVSMGRIALRNQLIMISSGVIVFLILIGLIVFTIWRRFDQRQRNYQAKLDQKYAEHENRVVRVFKEEFMELQTSMLEFSQGVKKHNLPYRDYRTFCLFSLFPEYHCELMLPVDPCTFGARKTAKLSAVSSQSPGMTRKEGDATSVPTHPLLSQFTVPEESHDAVSKGIALFHALICNRFFLSLMVRVIEEDEHISVQDRSRVASLLCAALQPKMEYLTRIMCDLMSDMLQRLHNQGNNRLPTAFRRAEAIVDKLVSNWLSFLLYNFIKNSVGEHLFYFYRALLHQLNTGPRDAVTGRARYTLDSSMLLPIELTGTLVTLTLEDPQSLFSLCSTQITVKVLDCDTVTQAKEKILDAIYKNRPYSQQWKPTQLDLVRLPEPCLLSSSAETLHPDGLILCDWDVSVRHDTQSYGSEKRPVRLNCIHDYELPDNARVALILSPYHRAKSLVTSTVSLRSPSLQTFRGKKSLQSSNPPVPDNLVNSTCSPEQTLLSDPTLVGTRPEATCAPLEQPSVTCGDYSRSLSCFSAPGHGTSHYPKSASTVPPQPNHCLRPTGHPDPALWYHLEFTGTSHTLETGVNNGTIGSGQRYPYSSSTTVHHLLNTSCPEDRTTRCAKRLRCNCAEKAEEPETTPSHFGRPTKLSWSTALQFLHKDSLAHSRRMVMNETSENTADYPLLHQTDGFARDDLIESVKYETLTATDSRSLSHGNHYKRRGRRKRQHSRDLSKSRQAPGTLDRPMESLPKEVFFNRLVVTRLSVTTFMDKLFEVVFSSVLQSHSLPSPIKYLFDFLDSQAVNLGVQDPKTVHAWKSNCLQMRFWNQIITNLDYIFDIPLLRRTAFERSFHALSQAMTYACAPTKEKLTPDSSSVKLLFARDISQQWTRVNNYYREIKAMPAIKREDMQDILRQHSANHANEFNVSWAIYELYMKYVKPCQASIVNQLQQEALKTHFPYKSQMMYDAKPASVTEEISPVDDFDFSEYNPIQLIQMLTEVERCMNDAQASTLLVRESMTTSTDFLAPSFHHAEASSPGPTYTNELLKHGSHPLSNSTAGPGLLRNVLSSAPSGDTTEYPDTLRSLNTLTTEFAGDETNRSAAAAAAVTLQQSQPYHHCYHMYGTNEPVLSSPIHTTSQQQQHGSSLSACRVPDPPA